jgi:hypothetical protein
MLNSHAVAGPSIDPRESIRLWTATSFKAPGKAKEKKPCTIQWVRSRIVATNTRFVK